ncbi:hypothetical protein SAMN04515669_3699 [Jiangella sp. DSM 45060]|nr:hypothetical protein SAMN04515669_3699 [Jiangella sp. DSM 45060]
MPEYRWSPLTLGRLTECPVCGPPDDGDERSTGWRWRWGSADPSTAERVCAWHLDLSDWAGQLGRLRWPTRLVVQGRRRVEGSRNFVSFTWHPDDWEGSSGSPTHDEAVRVEEVSTLVYPIDEEADLVAA